MSELTVKHCIPCEGGIPPLGKKEVKEFLKKVPKWDVDSEHKKILRKFTFKNFYHTMAFVNAVAWIANQENHHPDIEAGYNYCNLHYTTHANNGLTENDFICAAKINALVGDK